MRKKVKKVGKPCATMDKYQMRKSRMFDPLFILQIKRNNIAGESIIAKVKEISC
jgi:hypothetical protein